MDGVDSLTSVKAHFDGQQIILDEPFDLPANTPLIVTVLSASLQDRAEWSQLSARALERAYGDMEPEYSLSDIKRE